MSNFPLVRSVIHQKELDVVNVGDQEGLESRLGVVSGLGGVSKTDVGHHGGSRESSSDSVINTVEVSP